MPKAVKIKSDRPDELSQLIRAVDENAHSHWSKLFVLLMLSPAKVVFMFNNKALVRVAVSQIGGAHTEDPTLDARGCPTVLRKISIFCQSNKRFADAVAEFSGCKMDLSFKVIGDSLQSVHLGEA